MRTLAIFFIVLSWVDAHSFPSDWHLCTQSKSTGISYYTLYFVYNQFIIVCAVVSSSWWNIDGVTWLHWSMQPKTNINFINTKITTENHFYCRKIGCGNFQIFGWKKKVKILKAFSDDHSEPIGLKWIVFLENRFTPLNYNWIFFFDFALHTHTHTLFTLTDFSNARANNTMDFSVCDIV